jgi:hypothetical protein
MTQHQDLVLQSYNALRLRLDPVFFASKALGTLVFVPYYENLVCTVERVCFSREYRTRFPLISRLQGLLLSFALVYVTVRLLTMTGIFAGALVTLCRQSAGTLFRGRSVSSM